MKRWVVLIWVCLLWGCERPAPEYSWQLPYNMPPPPIPADNPLTPAKVALGRHLFYDPGLSANGLQSCGSCHQQAYGFSQPAVHSVGSTGEPHRRNALALVNVAYNTDFTWAHDGLGSLEAQILIPMFGESPRELNISAAPRRVLERLQHGPYPALFDAAFGDSSADFDRVNQALASFVRTLVSFDSPFDQYAYGQIDNALSESQIRGMNLFYSERLECFHCHGGFNFSQSSVHANMQINVRRFHNTGLYDVDGKGAYPDDDPGLIEISGQMKDMGRFRAPSLRNVAVTAPYMHDGSIATLEEVIDFYDRGGNSHGGHNIYRSPFIRPLNLKEQEKQDLLAFLQGLTDHSFLTNPAFAAPGEH